MSNDMMIRDMFYMSGTRFFQNMVLMAIEAYGGETKE